MNMTSAWYIRRQSDAEIKGPFPGGQISQELVLGRYRLDDEVSHDREEWLKIRQVPELVPEIFTEDRNDPAFKSKLAAARRWADERRGVADIEPEQDRRKGGWSYEDEEIQRLHRLALQAKKKNSALTTLIQVSVVFILVVALVVLAFRYSPSEESKVECDAAAQPGVNWSGCQLSGAKLGGANLTSANLMNANLQTVDLSSANLARANLKYVQLHLANLQQSNFTEADLTGATLMGANLSNTNFSHANLRYANLRDAIIVNTDFSQARLDNAIWIDGRTCAVNSIGSCK